MTKQGDQILTRAGIQRPDAEVTRKKELQMRSRSMRPNSRKGDQRASSRRLDLQGRG